MRTALALLMLAAAALAQSTRETVVFDLNGNRSGWTTSSSSNGTRTSQVQNLNGRGVPLESVEERVLSQQGGVKVVERLIQRYDASGARLPPEKLLIEETQRPGGGVSTVTTVFRGDLNGRLQPVERSLTESGKSGAETTIQRASLNGGFETVERRSATEQGKTRDEVTYRRDTNGNFTPVFRQVTSQVIQGGVPQEQVDEFEAATSGALQLAKQTVSRTTRTPDGAEIREITVFGPAAPGRPAGGALALREQQIYETRTRADGAVVETFGVRRPGLSDTGRLGEVHKISETVCRGNCKDAAKK